jgi:NAD-dependent dihydropyrimidine dehydrogenase PreA subunit
MVGLKYFSNVTTLALDEDKCAGCGMCATVCPHAVFEVADGKTRIADRDACMECGACALNCLTGALSVDAGVGCATAVIIGALRGTEADCGCSSGPSCCE